MSQNVLQKIRDIINDIRTADNFSEIRNVKKLKTYDSFYRIRLGAYRIGIELTETEVIFVRILHRKDVYRFFP